MPPSRVLLAEHHPLTMEGLKLATLSSLPDATFDEASSIAEAEAKIVQHQAYRFCVLDLLLPDAKGFAGLMRLQHLLKKTPVAVLSAQDGPLVDTARALGAAGFILKSMGLQDTATALSRIAHGFLAFPAGEDTPPETAGMTERLAQLSGAQMRVLLALADGRPNKMIAQDLDVTEATVKAHLTATFRKLGVGNRTQALLLLQPILGEIRQPDRFARDN